MSLFNWVIAGAVAAFVVAVPQSSQARFGPVGPVAQSGTPSLERTGGDNNLAPWQAGGYQSGRYVRPGGYYRAGSRYRGYRGYRRGYGRHYRRYRRGGNFSFSFGVGPSWGYGPGSYYYAPPPVVVYRSAPRARYRSGSYEPWSPGWYRYCSSKYRTFNPRTGYYFYRPGRQRFCR